MVLVSSATSGIDRALASASIIMSPNSKLADTELLTFKKVDCVYTTSLPT